jgi:hypothetical protein
MKKALAFIVVTVVVGTAAFAIPAFGVSVGAGGFITKAFGGGLDVSGDIPGGLSISGNATLPSWGGGGFVFLDATFVEVGIGFSSNSGSTELGGDLSTFAQSSGLDTSAKFSYTALDFSVVVKYPFKVGPVALFPMAGVNYKYVLSAKDDDGGPWKHPMGNGVEELAADKLSAFGLLFGAGLDFHIIPAFYLRGEILYNIRFANKFEKDTKKAFKDESGGFVTAKTKLGHGPTIKLGIGYKFF